MYAVGIYIVQVRRIYIIVVTRAFTCAIMCEKKTERSRSVIVRLWYIILYILPCRYMHIMCTYTSCSCIIGADAR